MTEDVYEDGFVAVWRDEENYQLCLLDRGFTIAFAHEDWIEFLSSMRNLFYKKNEEE